MTTSNQELQAQVSELAEKVLAQALLVSAFEPGAEAFLEDSNSSSTVNHLLKLLVGEELAGHLSNIARRRGVTLPDLVKEMGQTFVEGDILNPKSEASDEALYRHANANGDVFPIDGVGSGTSLHRALSLLLPDPDTCTDTSLEMWLRRAEEDLELVGGLVEKEKNSVQQLFSAEDRLRGDSMARELRHRQGRLSQAERIHAAYVTSIARLKKRVEAKA